MSNWKISMRKYYWLYAAIEVNFSVAFWISEIWVVWVFAFQRNIYVQQLSRSDTVGYYEIANVCLLTHSLDLYKYTATALMLTAYTIPINRCCFTSIHLYFNNIFLYNSMDCTTRLAMNFCLLYVSYIRIYKAVCSERARLNENTDQKEHTHTDAQIYIQLFQFNFVFLLLSFLRLNFRTLFSFTRWSHKNIHGGSYFFCSFVMFRTPFNTVFPFLI